LRLASSKAHEQGYYSLLHGLFFYVQAVKNLDKLQQTDMCGGNRPGLNPPSPAYTCTKRQAGGGMTEGIVLALIVGVVFVNGWTDAPNAIACAVSTGAMKYRAAAWMAGVCNLLGLLASYFAGALVTETIFSLAGFGQNPSNALIALSAAMVSIVLFAVAAWRAGIPVSPKINITEKIRSI